MFCLIIMIQQRYYYNRAYFLISTLLVDPVILKNRFNRLPFFTYRRNFHTSVQNRYDSALAFLEGPLRYCFPPNDFTLPVLYDVAISYKGQEKFLESLSYTKQLLEVAYIAGTRQDVCNGLKLTFCFITEMEENRQCLQLLSPVCFIERYACQ